VALERDGKAPLGAARIRIRPLGKLVQGELCYVSDSELAGRRVHHSEPRSPKAEQGVISCVLRICAAQPMARDSEASFVNLVSEAAPLEAIGRSLHVAMFV